MEENINYIFNSNFKGIDSSFREYNIKLMIKIYPEVNFFNRILYKYFNKDIISKDKRSKITDIIKGETRDYFSGINIEDFNRKENLEKLLKYIEKELSKILKFSYVGMNINDIKTYE